MPQFRITKYDPARRDSAGAYVADDWTSFSDIGKPFAGKVLTREDYEIIESEYVNAALALLKESAVTTLAVKGLENSDSGEQAPQEDASLEHDEIAFVLRGLLRGHFWCRLEANEAYVHVGWDYYMYVGIPNDAPRALASIGTSRLFVEPLASPYTNCAA